MVTNITYNNNTATIHIDFTFYDFVAILETSHEFTDSCWVVLLGNDDGMSVDISLEPKDSNNSVKEAVNSFFNFMLGVSNRRLKKTFL